MSCQDGLHMNCQDVKDERKSFNMTSCNVGVSSSLDGASSLHSQTWHSAYGSDIFWYMAWQKFQLVNYSNMIYNRCLALSIQNVGLMSTVNYYQVQNQLLNNRGLNNDVRSQREVQVQNEEPSVVKMASILARVSAELIDFMLLVLLKVIVINYWYGHDYLERFNFILIIDENTSFDDLEWMLIQAALFRLIVIIYEGYMLSGTLPMSWGATIGKRLVGIKVIYCHTVDEHDAIEQTVRVTQMKPLGVVRSCYRAILKNMAISFLFPMLLPIMMFSHRRLLYDLPAGSLVVQDDRRHAR